MGGDAIRSHTKQLQELGLKLEEDRAKLSEFTSLEKELEVEEERIKKEFRYDSNIKGNQPTCICFIYQTRARTPHNVFIDSDWSVPHTKRSWFG